MAADGVTPPPKKLQIKKKCLQIFNNGKKCYFLGGSGKIGYFLSVVVLNVCKTKTQKKVLVVAVVISDCILILIKLVLLFYTICYATPNLRRK